MVDFNKKRYMVIDRYPTSSDPIGAILSEGDYTTFRMDQYPKLFRLMNWWEYRYPEMMPQYVKKISDSDGYHVKGDVLIVEWIWNNQKLGGKGTSKWVAKVGQHYYNADVLVPITKEEYEKTPKENRPSL